MWHLTIFAGWDGSMVSGKRVEHDGNEHHGLCTKGWFHQWS